MLVPFKWCERRGEDPDSYGLNWRIQRRQAVECAVATALILSALTLVSINWPYEQLPRHSTLGRTIDLALSGVGAAIIEEIFFRGWIYPLIRKKLSAWAAIVITSAIFAAAHIFVAQTIFLFAVFFPGVVMTIFRERHGNIGTATVFHACGNIWAIWFAPLVWPGSESLRSMIGL